MATNYGMIDLSLLRSQLSEAACLLYHMQPHAFVRATLEDRPLASYIDPTAYDLAALLYFGTDSPQRDLRQCQDIVRLARF